MRSIKNNPRIKKQAKQPKVKKRTSIEGPHKKAHHKSYYFIAAGIIFSFIGIPAGIGSYLWSQGIIQNHLNRMEQQAIVATTNAGMILDEIFVHGRQETPTEDILAALDIDRGDPLINFDADAARKRIEKIGWIEVAAVERKFPNHIIVRIKEREPAAIWQSKNHYVLVDKFGEKITSTDINRFTELKVITGKNAPEHTINLMEIINAAPDLEKRIVGAAWISERRWTLYLDNKISIQLPENDPKAAWQRLALMIQDFELLERDIELIDMRQPDKTIVRMTGSGAKRLLGKKENA